MAAARPRRRPPRTRPPTTTTTRPPTTTHAAADHHHASADHDDASADHDRSRPTGQPCTPTSCPRVDNPYAGAGVYNNPQWRANAIASGASASLANQPTAIWLDRIAAIAGNNSPTTGSMGLVDHLDAAVTQDAANGATPMVIQVVIYNLPGRDCAALASNGELGPTEIDRYRNDYINLIAEIMRRPAYANLRIVTIIEIDSLPNLVTNADQQAGATENCRIMKANGNYVTGVRYALQTLGAIPNVYNYIDAAHHGWIGWSSNFGPSANLFARRHHRRHRWLEQRGRLHRQLGQLPRPCRKCTSPSTPASTASRCATRDGSTSTTTSTS